MRKDVEFSQAKLLIEGKSFAEGKYVKNRRRAISKVENYYGDIRLLDRKGDPFAYFCDGVFWDCLGKFQYVLFS